MSLSEIENLNIKHCLSCDTKLIDSNVLCCDCYKLNLNTLYKVIKPKSDKSSYNLLKEFIKNEKYNGSNTKPKMNICIEHKKHLVEL